MSDSFIGVVEDTRFLTVEVPGTVKNCTTVTNALGTTRRLTDILEGRATLTLDMSKGSPFGRPLDGNMSTTRKLILRVKRKKNTDGEKKAVSVDFLGYGEQHGTFNQIGDFVAVPPPSAVEDAYGLTEFLKNPDECNPAPLYMLPNRLTKPTSYVMSFSSIGAASKQHARFHILEQSFTDDARRMNLHPYQAAQATAWRFRDLEIPSTPRYKFDFSTLSENDQILHQVIQKATAERPIWMRSQIEAFIAAEGQRLGQTWTTWQLRKGLSLHFFHSVDGPWRGTLIKYGFDPRTEPEARFFQTIDFRDPHSRSSGFKLDVATSDNMGRSKTGLWSVQTLSSLKDGALQRYLGGVQPVKVCDEFKGWWPAGVLNDVRRHLTLKSQRSRLVTGAGEE